MTRLGRMLGRLGLFSVLAGALSACGGGGGGGGSAAPQPPPPERWLIMVYIVADNNLDDPGRGSAPWDINQMESAPASPYVTTVVQVDTQDNPIAGSNSAKRLRIVPDGDPDTITSPVLQDLGEILSTATTAIRDFVVWARGMFPADRYMLVLWDHGNQWQGFGQDFTSPGTGQLMSLATLDSALNSARLAAGISKFDIVGFDACLMAAAEVDQMLALHAVNRVASCEVEMGGWNYRSFLTALAGNPGMGARSLAQAVCDSYIAVRTNTSQTMSAAALANSPPLVGAIDAFATALKNNLGSQFASIQSSRRDAAEYLLSDQPVHSGYYLDLRHFTSLILSRISLPAVVTSGNNLLAAIDSEVFYKAQGALALHHGGVSIYFPSCSCDPQFPNYSATYLAISTQWDEFLNSYYAIQNGDVTAPGVSITAPSDGTWVSSASPATIDFTLTGADIFDVSAVVSIQLSATQYQVLREIEWGRLGAGTWNVGWDAKAYVLWDGVAAYSDWLGAMSSRPGSDSYRARVRHTPVGGIARDVWMEVYLPKTLTTGYVLGFYGMNSSGGVSSATVNPGDTLRVLYPIYSTSTKSYTYTPSSVLLTVPSGGSTALQIYQAGLSAGTHHFAINAEDYAANFGIDSVWFNVP